jgi:cell fate regulator YaaT (PSP1 superfamily)
MGCISCATDVVSGKPKGCKSNGGCQTGSCNKMNTFDWFSEMPIAFGMDDFKIHEISFSKGVRKAFFKNDKNLQITTGDMVAVQTTTGIDVGEVSLSGELVRLQMRKRKVKENEKDLGSIVRIATERDIELMNSFRVKEPDTMRQARVIARNMKLEMKVSNVEYQADGKKATFYYIAEGRVDFRELIKAYAHDFKVKVEMKQIGARQEAGLVGGIGSCGRELCCSTWLADFKSVKTDAARYQNLSINMQKLSGQCGRLKCCLNYELDTYLEAVTLFPERADTIDTKNGKLRLQKTDILRGLMYYAYESKSDKFYPFKIEQVKQMLENASKGILIDSVYEVIEEEVDEEKEAYQDLVGQISLDTLEKKDKRKKRNKNRDGRQQKPDDRRQPRNEKQQPPQNKNQQQSSDKKQGPNPNRNRRPDNRNKNRNRGNSDDKKES